MDSSSKYWFSVVIITFNEAENIGACLKSVAGLTDDILVVDSYSTDQTQNISINLGARFLQRAFTNYGDQKNWANQQARYDYILSLDADEVLSESLKQSILALEQPNALAYGFNRLSNYCGHWVKHSGWYPDFKVRLFDRQQVRWESIAVHEGIQLPPNTQISRLEGDLLHYTFRTQEAHRTQVLKFNTLKAELLFERGKTVNSITKYLRPLFKFFKIYVWKRGFLDGRAGFAIAKYSAAGERIKWQTLQELKSRQT
ncbi:MAG: glycosyltransferase family 2 protein [Bacteroidota bacterium]